MPASLPELLNPFAAKISQMCIELLSWVEEDPTAKFVDLVSVVRSGVSTLPLRENFAPPEPPSATKALSQLKLKSTATPLAETVRLKNRVVLNKISLSISEPRGKYVKTIKIYYTPDPESDEFEAIGQINLTKGALSGSCTIPAEVKAAALRFEYAEFFEKLASSEGAAMCPRCSRTVTSAHGICGSCGEHVLQCRRCRSLNYENVGSFLCVDCGYCASGTFSWSLVGHQTSDAVAVQSQESYDRLAKALASIETKLTKEVKNLMRLRNSLMAMGRVLRMHLGFSGAVIPELDKGEDAGLEFVLEGGWQVGNKKKKGGGALSAQQQVGVNKLPRTSPVLLTQSSANSSLCSSLLLYRF